MRARLPEARPGSTPRRTARGSLPSAALAPRPSAMPAGGNAACAGRARLLRQDTERRARVMPGLAVGVHPGIGSEEAEAMDCGRTLLQLSHIDIPKRPHL